MLVNREFRDLAKPRLWQRLAFDTRTQPLASLRVLLGAKLFPRVCHLIVRLDIFVGKGKAHVDNVGVLFAISSLMMRLPNLRVCTIEVSQQADATATQLIQALHFAASPLTHLTIDWYIPVSIDLQEMLFHALSTHRYSLDALALYFSDGTTMCPGELSMLEVLQHLTLGRCSVTEVPVNSVAKETVGPLASLLTLDLDASIDFTSLWCVRSCSFAFV